MTINEFIEYKFINFGYIRSSKIKIYDYIVVVIDNETRELYYYNELIAINNICGIMEVRRDIPRNISILFAKYYKADINYQINNKIICYRKKPDKLKFLDNKIKNLDEYDEYKGMFEGIYD